MQPSQPCIRARRPLNSSTRACQRGTGTHVIHRQRRTRHSATADSPRYRPCCGAAGPGCPDTADHPPAHQPTSRYMYTAANAAPPKNSHLERDEVVEESEVNHATAPVIRRENLPRTHQSVRETGLVHAKDRTGAYGLREGCVPDELLPGVRVPRLDGVGGGSIDALHQHHNLRLRVLQPRLRYSTNRSVLSHPRLLTPQASVFGRGGISDAR